MEYWFKKTKNDDLKKKIPFFKKEIDQFIKEISFVDFPMRLFWRELMETLNNIFDRLKKRRN